MKKEILRLGRSLTRKELKTIHGGEPGTCAACQDVYSTEPLEGYEPYTFCVGGYISGVSRATAEAHVSNGGRWCCDSCSSALWYRGEPTGILPGGFN